MSRTECQTPDGKSSLISMAVALVLLAVRLFVRRRRRAERWGLDEELK